ncbi:hypothetical protein Btru_070766 [Bulinus truncatus]|nr:hypothetical protein Btru_070766 [Bulinus truncatus]
MCNAIKVPSCQTQDMSANPAEELKDFPCNFNLVNVNRLSHQRLMSVKDNIEADLDRGDYLPEETLRNLNLLTWVMFRLNENDEALRLNKQALNMTKRKSITSLGSLIFITAHLEYRMETKLKYVKELQDLKSQENFDSLLTEALAEQAYSYSRLGNANNYKLCCELFERCTEKCPENYLCKYGLGLAYRRLTEYNLRCSDSDRLDPAELTEKCTSILFEVAWGGDIYLKGLAYAQLASLRQYNFQREQDDLFNFLNIQQLVRKAVRYGSRNPAVLTQCGKCLKMESIDWSIDLLRRSLQLRKNSIAFHHLGLSLLRKHFRVKDEGFLRSKSNLAPYGMGSLQLFSSFPARSSLDKENELVKEAKFCFEKSLEVCHGENKPARLSLGNILLKSGQIKDALVEFKKIIDSNERSHFPTVVSAHELAGECS